MYLCVWLDKKLKRIEIENIAPDGKLKELRNFASSIVNKNLEFLGLVNRGRFLDDDEKSLVDYDIRGDSEIHVVFKESSDKPSITFTDEEFRKMLWELSMLGKLNNFHAIAHKVIKNQAASIIRERVPHVSNTAVAYLLHPELLLSLRDPKLLRKIAEKEPSIIKAGGVIYDLIRVQAEQAQSAGSNLYLPINSSSGDEEDMDSNTESSRDSHSPSRNLSGNTITPAQLAAAIASATNSVANNVSTSSSSSNSNIITNEMFSNALQQAFSSTPSSTPPVTPNTLHENLNFSSLSRRFENELRQMHELGLTNDAVNIRALQTTSGNIQEALELVLNGVMD